MKKQIKKQNFKRYTVPHRRKREGKTDYKKRLALLKMGLPRLVVRRSLRNMNAQLVSYSSEGDKIEISSHTNELQKLGWKYSPGNISSAYLTGLYAAKKALKKGISDAILDIGLFTPTPKTRLFAVLKGAVDAGLKIPHNESVLPEEEIVSGAKIRY